MKWIKRGTGSKKRIRSEESVKPRSNKVKKPSKVSLKAKLWIFIPLVVLLLAGGGTLLYFNWTYTVVLTPYELTGRYGLDMYLDSLNSYNMKNLSAYLGKTESYLVQEWGYANKNPLVEDFIKMVVSTVDFEYPTVQGVNRFGNPIVNRDGTIPYIEVDMLDGEPITLTLIDYEAIEKGVLEDSKEISDWYKSSGLEETDYLYDDKMRDFFLEYILGLDEVPLRQEEITLNLVERVISEGVSTLMPDSDVELDNLLFASDSFHSLLDTFVKVSTGLEENALVDYDIEIEEYEEEVEIEMEDGEKRTITEIKEREVKTETRRKPVINTYWVGAFYNQNTNPEGVFLPRSGDGTFDFPAGVGTSVVTKAVQPDGTFKDIRVTLMGYWYGDEAIQYALRYSEKNRGFDSTSILTLATFEVLVENLEDEPIYVDSQLVISDRDANSSARTGTMYGIVSEAKLEPKESILLQDWYTSTTLLDRYLIWGKDFKRLHDVVWFDVFAFDNEESDK